MDDERAVILENAAFARVCGRLDEALALYDRALALAAARGVTDGDIENEKGNVLKELGRAAEAEAVHRATLARDERNVHALNNLGVIQKDQHRYDEAVALYERALAIEPHFDVALHNLAIGACAALVGCGAGAARREPRLACRPPLFRVLVLLRLAAAPPPPPPVDALALTRTCCAGI